MKDDLEVLGFFSFITILGLIISVATILTTIGVQSDRDARRIDRIEQQLNIRGPDEPTPTILEELRALQTAEAK